MQIINKKFCRSRFLKPEISDSECFNENTEKSYKTNTENNSRSISAYEEGQMPSSPALRQTTFGATLDFVDALCNASAGLLDVPQVTLKSFL